MHKLKSNEIYLCLQMNALQGMNEFQINIKDKLTKIPQNSQTIILALMTELYFLTNLNKKNYNDKKYIKVY